jgi:ElaA protein
MCAGRDGRGYVHLYAQVEPAGPHPARTIGGMAEPILRTARFADLDTTTLYALLKLRVDVFVVEQESPYPDLDGRDTDPDAVHLWLERDGAPAAYLRILTDPDGAARIGRVVVAAEARGDRLAGRLMTAALDLIGDRPAALEAQSYLADFYRRFGFVATAPEYVEDGIPHLPMRRVGPPNATAGRRPAPPPTGAAR